MNPLAQADPLPEPVPLPEPPAQPPEAGAIVPQPVPPVGPHPANAGLRELYWNLGLVGAGVIGVALVFALLKYWTRRQMQDCDTTSLGSFREMYENGELSDEEYEQIRNKMAAKMKGKLGIKPGTGTLPKPGVGRQETPPPPESSS